MLYEESVLVARFVLRPRATSAMGPSSSLFVVPRTDSVVVLRLSSVLTVWRSRSSRSRRSSTPTAAYETAQSVAVRGHGAGIRGRVCIATIAVEACGSVLENGARPRVVLRRESVLFLRSVGGGWCREDRKKKKKKKKKKGA